MMQKPRGSTHGFLRADRLAECICGDWHPISSIEAEAAAPDPASPHEALRLLAAVLDQFDYWTGEPRPAADGGKVRLHDFWEVQPAMEKVLAEARRYLAATEEGTP